MIPSTMCLFQPLRTAENAQLTTCRVRRLSVMRWRSPKPPTSKPPEAMTAKPTKVPTAKSFPRENLSLRHVDLCRV
ncbi:hypothetical protein Tco_1202070 [Tanacetum coccineum]